jgi:hypothetical protein
VEPIHWEAPEPAPPPPPEIHYVDKVVEVPVEVTKTVEVEVPVEVTKYVEVRFIAMIRNALVFTMSQRDLHEFVSGTIRSTTPDRPNFLLPCRWRRSSSRKSKSTLTCP